MKPEELRIGNLVNDPYSDYTNVDFNVLHYIAICELNKQIQGKYTPIPLTEEWLLKFGFYRVKHRTGIQAAYKLKNLRLNMSNCANFYIYKLPVDSVHQLQNLYFALTQTELTIK